MILTHLLMFRLLRGAGVGVSPGVGEEWTLPEARVHYTMKTSRMHWTLPEGREHTQLETENP